MDSEPILKKTLVTVGAMVGACVAFVGTVSLVAVLVTSHVVGSSGESRDSNATITPGALGSPGGPGPRAPHSDSVPSHSTPRAHDTI